MIKGAFYFTSKALFGLKIFEFLPLLSGFTATWLIIDQKDKVNFKIYDVTAWLTNNYSTHLPNISRSKDNQTMKPGQLIDYDMSNIFLEKPYTKCGEETRPFLKKLKLRLSLDQQSKVL